MGQCYSGGFLDSNLLKDWEGNDGIFGTIDDQSAVRSNDPDGENNLNDLNNVIIATSQDYRLSHSGGGGAGLSVGFLFRHHIALNPTNGHDNLMVGTALYDNGALNFANPDTDNNGMVSLYEAYIYARDNDDYAPWGTEGRDDLPQYWDTLTIGCSTYL